MRNPRAALGAVGLSLVAVAPAAAQPTTSPTILCIPGQPNACFATAWEFGASSATMWLQNLQGSYTTDPTPLSIHGFYISRITTPNATGIAAAPFTFARTSGAFGVAEGAVVPGALNNGWGEGSTTAEDPATLVQTRFYWNGGLLHSLYGCNLPAGQGPGWWQQTCPQQGANGWLRFDFIAYVNEQAAQPFTQRPLTADDFAFEAFTTSGSCAVVGASSGVAAGGMVAHVDCISAPYSEMTVTPEPATAALLGGGLLALGGVGVVRRRRGRTATTG